MPAFVDAHVHFWDQRVLPYPWLESVPSIAGPHTPSELTQEAGDDYPTKIVFVECGAPPDREVGWIEQLAENEPHVAGIVAHRAVDLPASAEAKAWQDLASRPLVRGVRQNIQDEKAAGFCTRPEFIAGVRALGVAGLSFDVCCRHHQLPDVVRLVQSCPDTRFILDHFGKPDIKAGQLDPWRHDFAALAKLPNVVCKLSGLITEADHATWTIDHLRPFVAHALDTFGPSRLLFGGDWSVAKLAGSYRRWLSTARELVAHRTTAEQQAIFHDNAIRAYRLS